ncbi:MAG TPA: hypothetical protein DDW52_22000 [Planctomycetaceae bacterium]|nr:hypothetical protein [Planctomycetaceae bacterium]
MGARLIVQSGTASGSTHWIEKKVVRVGSDPACDIVLPDTRVDGHALTIEFCAPNYRVHNRSDQQITIGSMLLSPGEVVHWPDSDLLQLDDLVLALEIDVDPRPEPAPPRALHASPEAEFSSNTNLGTAVTWERSPENADSASQRSEASRSSVKTMVQIAVIVCCFAGCGLLLARERFKGIPADATPAPSLDVVVEQALASGDATTAALVGQLQLAEAARVRMQFKTARQKYRRLYDRLSIAVSGERGPSETQPHPARELSPSDQADLKTLDQDSHSLMLRFVESRLK